VSTPKLIDEFEDSVMAVFRSLSARVIKHLPDLDFTVVEEQLTQLRRSLAVMADDLGTLPFVIEITQEDDSAGAVLDAKAIVSSVGLPRRILTVGKNLHVLRSSKFTSDSTSPTPVQLSEASEDTLLFSRSETDTVTVCAGGRTVGFFNLRHPTEHPPAGRSFNRLAEDYQIAVLDHYRRCVQYWQRTDHWAKRPDRILRSRLGSAHKTELIFHNDLHHWLDTNLSAQVWSGPRDTTGDQLDIIITAPSGKTYLIEVKWIGKNEKTSYTIKTVTKGLKQMGTYLKKQAKISEGLLVAYDARKLSEFDVIASIGLRDEPGCKWLAACETVPVPARGNCLILFLESKTASDS
jgi:hypothetical protein